MLQGHSAPPRPPPAEQGLWADISAPNMCALLLFPTLPGPSGLSESPLESHGYTCLAADFLAVPRPPEVRLPKHEMRPSVCAAAPDRCALEGHGRLCRCRCRAQTCLITPAVRGVVPQRWTSSCLTAKIPSQIACGNNTSSSKARQGLQ